MSISETHRRRGSSGFEKGWGRTSIAWPSLRRRHEDFGALQRRSRHTRRRNSVACGTAPNGPPLTQACMTTSRTTSTSAPRAANAEAADRALQVLTGRLASLRCKVRRCMRSARAVAEMFPSFSTKTFWMCSHSSRSMDIGVSAAGVQALPGAGEGAPARCAGWRRRAMNAVSVVIVLELRQLPGQVHRIAEKCPIEVLTPDRSHEPLDERMRYWRVGNRLDLLEGEDAQLGQPTVKTKQRVVIGAEMFRPWLSGDGMIEHTTDRDAIDRCAFDAETDQPARAHLHDPQHPVRAQ